MNERSKLITEQALALSADERERLYETLLLSLQERSERDEADFREEIRSRREAFLSGEMSARPFEDILRERLVNGKMVNGAATGFISGPKLPKVR
jgi:hypothetical protein